MSSFIKISLGNQVKVIEGTDAEKAMEVADEMVSLNGGGIPKIEVCDKDGNVLPVPEEAAPDTDRNPEPAMSEFGAVIHDEKAADRLSHLYDTLEASGVSGIERERTAMGFTPGDRMADIGYSTQAQRKIEHENKMPVSQAIAELQAAVINEGRQDHSCTAKEFAENLKIVNGKLTAFGYSVSEFSLEGLFRNRLKSPGGLGYVLGLRDRFKAEWGDFSFNQDRARLDIPWLAEVIAYEARHYGEVPLKLRTRKNPHDIFAIVSPTYSPIDAPMVIKQFSGKIPADAKGSWAYNAESTSWNLEIANWTPTPTLEQAIGEPVSAHLSFSSADNGTQRFRGGGGILIIQCLNASLYEADSVSASRVHKGRNTLFDIAGMIRSAMKSINILAEAWGNSRKVVIEPPTGLTVNQVIPGLYRSLLGEKPLMAVLSGRKEDNVEELSRAYFDQRRNKEQITSADLMQGWTAHIRSLPNDVRSAAEAAAGDFLVHPKPVKYLAKE